MSRVRGSRTAGGRKELGRQKHKTRNTCGGLRHAAGSTPKGAFDVARPSGETRGRARAPVDLQTSHDASISDRRFREIIHARVGAAASKPALLARDLRGREFEACEESARGKTGGGRRSRTHAPTQGINQPRRLIRVDLGAWRSIVPAVAISSPPCLTFEGGSAAGVGSTRRRADWSRFVDDPRSVAPNDRGRARA